MRPVRERERRRNSDPTNRNRIPGLRRRVTRQWTGTPDSQPDAYAGKSGGDRVKDPRLTLGGLPICPVEPLTPLRRRGQAGRPSRQRGGRAWEKSAEAIVGRRLGKAIEALQGRGAEQRIGRAARFGRRAESSIARSSLGDSMGVKRQQSSGAPLYLWEDVAPVRPGAGGDGRTETAACEERQAFAASAQDRALTGDLPRYNGRRNRRIR